MGDVAESDSSGGEAWDYLLAAYLFLSLAWGHFWHLILLGGAKNFMIGSLIEEQFKGSAGNWPFGAAASMILLSMVLVALMYYARAQSKAEAR